MSSHSTQCTESTIALFHCFTHYSQKDRSIALACLTAPPKFIWQSLPKLNYQACEFLIPCLEVLWNSCTWAWNLSNTFNNPCLGRGGEGERWWWGGASLLASQVGWGVHRPLCGAKHFTAVVRAKLSNQDGLKEWQDEGGRMRVGGGDEAGSDWPAEAAEGLLVAWPVIQGRPLYKQMVKRWWKVGVLVWKVYGIWLWSMPLTSCRGLHVMTKAP